MATQKKELDETAIKTRLGLILQGVLREALTQAGFKFEENHQYDPTCEKPDFLIPDATNPKFVIEVHQTEARNSFQMKVLRAFTAVTEAKVFYGKDIISVNVLFGDPNKEIPASNVKALYGFFDVNAVPRYQAANPELIENLEAKALQLASDKKHDVGSATEYLIRKKPSEIQELSQTLKDILHPSKTADEFLLPMWALEEKRSEVLLTPPEIGQTTHDKRNILSSLYFDEQEFAEISTNYEPTKCTANCSELTKKQLILTNLAEGNPSLKGIIIKSIKPVFLDFIKSSNASHTRNLCQRRLALEPAMSLFFEDIRNSLRRIKMADIFLEILKKDQGDLVAALVENLSSDVYQGIEHSRTWIADFLPIVAGVSQNEFNRRIVKSGRDIENYQYPFNNITGKFERLRNSPNHFRPYSEACVHIYLEICQEKGVDCLGSDRTSQDLEKQLLKLRLDGVIKLQRFNPLYEVMKAISYELGLDVDELHIESMIYDLAGGDRRLGKNDVFVVRGNGREIIAKLVAAHDQNGDHKSKEWGARRRSTLYRFINGEICPSEYQDALFVVDGEWKSKDINRLYKSGWNHIIRLHDLEARLREIFDIPDSDAK